MLTRYGLGVAAGIGPVLAHLLLIAGLIGLVALLGVPVTVRLLGRGRCASIAHYWHRLAMSVPVVLWFIELAWAIWALCVTRFALGTGVLTGLAVSLLPAPALLVTWALRLDGLDAALDHAERRSRRS